MVKLAIVAELLDHDRPCCGRQGPRTPLRSTQTPTPTCGILAMTAERTMEPDTDHRRKRCSTEAIRCLIPGFDGALFSREWKDALWTCLGKVESP